MVITSSTSAPVLVEIKKTVKTNVINELSCHMTPMVPARQRLLHNAQYQAWKELYDVVNKIPSVSRTFQYV